MLFINTNNATPIPSLNNDSPSITVEVAFGRPSLFNMLVAAIGSVGDIIHPSNMHVVNVIWIFSMLVNA